MVLFANKGQVQTIKGLWYRSAHLFSNFSQQSAKIWKKWVRINENLIIQWLFKTPISNHFMLSIREVWHVMAILLSYLFCIKPITWEYVFPITLSPLTFIILSPVERKIITQISLSRCFSKQFLFCISIPHNNQEYPC